MKHFLTQLKLILLPIHFESILSEIPVMRCLVSHTVAKYREVEASKDAHFETPTNLGEKTEMLNISMFSEQKSYPDFFS